MVKKRLFNTKLRIFLITWLAVSIALASYSIWTIITSKYSPYALLIFSIASILSIILIGGMKGRTIIKKINSRF